MTEPFTMPIIQERVWLTWTPTARDRARALTNHGQTLERLKERGGVDWGELDAILRDISWSAIRQGGAEIRCHAEIESRGSGQ